MTLKRLTIVDLAEALAVPVKTIHAWRAKGEGPPALKVGRHLRFRPEDVLPDPETRRLIRKRAGLSQAAMAEVLGVCPHAVARWEAGLRHPRGEHLERYGALLDRLMEELSR
jgi:DNA-binding transcriptional regulator YiaG